MKSVVLVFIFFGLLLNLAKSDPKFDFEGNEGTKVGQLSDEQYHQLLNNLEGLIVPKTKPRTDERTVSNGQYGQVKYVEESDVPTNHAFRDIKSLISGTELVGQSGKAFEDMARKRRTQVRLNYVDRLETCTEPGPCVNVALNLTACAQSSPGSDWTLCPLAFGESNFYIHTTTLEQWNNSLLCHVKYHFQKLNGKLYLWVKTKGGEPDYPGCSCEKKKIAEMPDYMPFVSCERLINGNTTSTPVDVKNTDRTY